MALVESTEIDKIEVVGPHKAVQVRKALVVKKDGVEIARSLEKAQQMLMDHQLLMHKIL